jgi:hypothetical protein
MTNMLSSWPDQFRMPDGYVGSAVNGYSASYCTIIHIEPVLSFFQLLQNCYGEKFTVIGV